MSFRLDDFTISRPLNPSSIEAVSPSLRPDQTFDTNEQSTKNAARKELTIEIPEVEYT